MNILSWSKSVSFDAQKDIPPLNGKVILVTGGNIGLGKQSVLEFARHNPHQIWLAARNPQRAQEAADEIREIVPDAPIRLLELDLSSFESIKKAVNTFLSQSDRLDILMCNAGIMAAPAGLTRDGYEIQFGTNHLGHALLTKLLLPTLLRTAAMPDTDVRVISLSSRGHTAWTNPGLRLDLVKTKAEELGGYTRYFQSKLANVLWARQLAKEYPQLTVASIHPGVVQTGLMRGATGGSTVMTAFLKLATPFVRTVENGARNQLWASVSKDVTSGEYYEPVGVPDLASPQGKDDALAQVLWDWTQEELSKVR
ncbi:hypothetical protein QBC47DRAFT_421866 [Echria macrotheca]|uniref:Short-chain dehydrogenase/reductase n=1 Tax=Echria macrotheca TaxID=438768 RepID=A0AAJ0BED6_9PEZI|nr:hypothetical protein QBC47DRAFT_421866 [Echria macrotheca]